MILAFHLFICLFEVFIYEDFIRAVLPERRWSRGQRMLMVIFTALGIWWINRLGLTIINFIGFPVCLLFLTFLLCKANWMKMVLFCFLGFFIIAGCEFLVGYLTAGRPGGQEKELIRTLTAKLTAFLFLHVAKSFPGRRKSEYAPFETVWFYLPPAASILVYFGLLYGPGGSQDHGFGRYFITAGCIGLMAMNLIIFFFYEKMIAAMEERREKENFDIKSRFEEKYYTQLEAVNEEYGQIVHDMRHIFQVIGSLAQSDNNENIVELLKKMETNIENVGSHFFCDNRIVNAVLAEKNRKLKDWE